MRRFPRGLRVLLTVAVLGLLVWRWVPADYFYFALGAVAVITTAVVYFTYCTPRVRDDAPSNNLPQEELSSSPIAVQETGENTLAASGSMLDYIKSSQTNRALRKPLPRGEKPVEQQSAANEASAEIRKAPPVETSEPKKAEGTQPMPLFREESNSLAIEEKTRLMNASWYRCENPFCKYTQFLDIHRIIPEKDGGTNKLDNLIVLCAYCHALAEKHEIPVEEMQEWINSADRFKSHLDWPYK